MPGGPPAPQRRRTLAYNPALDGLRAVAVVGVLLFHGGVSWVPGGFLGVDVFFVLSGYLITTLLLRERVADGGIDLGAFWSRRLRRLLPALLLLLVGVAVATPFLVDPAQRGSVGGDGIAALAYVANWRFVLTEQSYFAGSPSPLRHLWSLAVEEQWYLLFPVVVAVVLRRTRRISAFFVGLLAATVASAVWMAVVAGRDADPSRAYYGTDTRAHTLLVGSLLAVAAAQWPLHRHRRLLAAWGALGALAVLAAYALVGEADAWMYRGGFLAFAVASAGVVAAVAVARPGPRATRLLALAPLVAIGRVSYGLYLWHWPVDVALTPSRTGLDGDGWWVEPALLALRTGVAVALTLASYHLVEQRVRRQGLDGIPLPAALRSRPAAAVLVGTAVVAAALVVGSVPHGDEDGPTALASAEAGVPDVAPVAPPEGKATVPAGGLAPVPADRPLRVMVTGDSVGFTLTYGATGVPPGIEASGRAVIGCGLLPGLPIVAGRPDPIAQDCDGWPAYWQEGAAQHRPDVVALVFGAWEVYDHDVDGARLVVGTPEMAAALRASLDEGVRAVLAVAPEARFALVGTPCMDPPDDRLGPDDPARERTDPERLRWVNQQVEGYAASLGPRAAYLDLGELLCPDGEVRREVDGVVVRPDGLHYEPSTTGPTWAWLGPRLEALARTPVAADAVVAPGAPRPGG